ncbi:hypothetical protein PMIN04_012955 [Paraphaeosphaeria minitans]|uniref:BTB domain-containing protein n=1 Tax=Paraphaeosphaeria minitans TaxID=565426 RepID=A0A9P6KJD6_9PLEO|nr:hypothetical protein PMIN01_13490 [Paraphaeosphaeria minitans]
MLRFQNRAPSACAPEPLPGTRSAAAKNLLGNIASLFNDAKYSDATVQIYDTPLPVHKAIICIQSEYFEKAFQDKFVEGSSRTISFREGSGAAYWRVFEYLYTGDYLDELSTDRLEDDPELLRDTRVYALADMLLLGDLKALCVAKFKDKVRNLWNSDSFPDCVQEVYATTSHDDCNMRLAVLEVATAHARELRDKDIFTDLLREGGEFSVDYVNALTKMLVR